MKKAATTVPSIRALAPLLGMSHTTLNKHLRAGKFKAEKGGGFDPDKVRLALKQNGDLVQPSQAKGTRPARSPKKAPEPDAEELEVTDDSAFRDYNKAKASRERVRLEREQMELAARKLELISATEVKDALGRMISSARSAILLLPAKLAPRVASMSDVREIQVVIDTEMRELLTELSRYSPIRADECAPPTT